MLRRDRSFWECQDSQSRSHALKIIYELYNKGQSRCQTAVSWFIPSICSLFFVVRSLGWLPVVPPTSSTSMVRVRCLLLSATGLAAVPTSLALLPPPFLPHTGVHSVRNSARVRQEEKMLSAFVFRCDSYSDDFEDYT